MAGSGKRPEIHWTALAGGSPWETLGPLLLCLRGKAAPPAKVVLLRREGEEDGSPLLAALEALLEARAPGASLEEARFEDGPEGFARALEKIAEGGRTFVDVSPRLPSYMPVLAAQAAGKDDRLLPVYLHLADERWRGEPLPLVPRAARRLFVLQGGEARVLEPSSPEGPGKGPSRARRRSSWVLPAEQSVFLVNGLLELGYDRNVALNLSLLRDLRLCRLHFGERGVEVGDFIDEDRYEKRRDQVCRSLSRRTRREIPDYDQMAQLLYAAGALRPASLSRLEEELERIASRPLHEGGDVHHLALDTNLLRDRFYTVYLRGLDLPPNVDFVLCETVRSELVNRKEKIKGPELDEMASLGRETVRDLFFNQNPLEDRLRYVGLLEFNRMKAATGCMERDGGSAPSSARNDRYILDAYSSFVSVGCKVLFLPRDQETVRMMRGEEGVQAFLLENRERPRGGLDLSWDAFLQWVHLLGVAFGRLEWAVGGSAVATLDGVWAGKTVEQWERDCVRVSLVPPRRSEDREDHELLARAVRRDVEESRLLEGGG